MQTDMHYYGTYAMARAAGFRESIARTIATAAEYVDDSDRLEVTCIDGFHISAEPTAHHPTNFKANTDPQDQRRTWVPFHFVPGLQGVTVEERLVCRADSQNARNVVANTLSNLDKTFSVQLLGILAHSFVDTFSHYGFSGISSAVNTVDSKSFNLQVSMATNQSLNQLLNHFIAKYAVGPLANFLVQLGHGSVATYPDQPYLIWEFSYLNPMRPSGLRENPKTFLLGCERLHEVFVAARGKFNGVHDDRAAFREFGDIRKAVAEVLAVEGPMDIRIKAWQQAMQQGRICGQAQQIPQYAPGMFTQDLLALNTYVKEKATRTLVYGFLEAADFHRNFILNELLPKAGIQIQSAPIQWYSQGEEQ